jgi:hypothetical protein
MSEQPTKQQIVESNIDEEASVIEILRALVRQHPSEDEAAHKEWLNGFFREALATDLLGFYIDEFGARDIYEVGSAQVLSMLDDSVVWDPRSDTMLHPFYHDQSD